MTPKSALVCMVLTVVIVEKTSCDVELNNRGTTNFTPVLNMTQCASSTICTDVWNYPAAHVLQAFQGNTTRYRHYLSVDRQDTDIVNRFIDIDQTLCDATVELQEPKAGRNKDDEWLFIVNHGDYKQAVEVRICKNENKPCNMNENFPVRTECRQKYILRKMLALDPKDGQLKEDTIKLPSCCSCRYFDNKSK